MNEKQLRENLLQNYCQIGSCGKKLNQYEIFCIRHWRLLPFWAMKQYSNIHNELKLNKSLDRTEAWKQKVKEIGIQEAGNLIGKYREAIELFKSLIKNELGFEFNEKVRLSKWGTKNQFNESYSTDRTWL